MTWPHPQTRGGILAVQGRPRALATKGSQKEERRGVMEWRWVQWGRNGKRWSVDHVQERDKFMPEASAQS